MAGGAVMLQQAESCASCGRSRSQSHGSRRRIAAVALGALLAVRLVTPATAMGTKEGAAGHTSATAAPTELSPFETAFRDWIEAHHVTAASLAVMRGDRLVLARGYGSRGAFDRVQVWSLSKAITAVCVAQLVAEGRVRFEEAIGPLLPELFSGARAAADLRLARVTIGQLVAQRSGLPWRGFFGGLTPRVADLLTRMRPDQVFGDSLAPTVLGLSLHAPPGERFAYSNLKHLLLGEVIEAVTGRAYADACRERVMDRAGVMHASLGKRWGNMTGAAGGWALSGPEYLAFVRLLRPRAPDPVGAAGRAWLEQPEGKWTDASRSVAYMLGVFIRPKAPGGIAIWHDGSRSWRQPNALGGAINEQKGTQFVLKADGTAWFVSFDGVSGDDPSTLDLDRALFRASQLIEKWPDGDLFGELGIGPVKW